MEFFDVLVRYEVALWSTVDRELAAAGLAGLGTVHALRLLDRRSGAARVQDLSSDIGITVGAASKLVDRLERDGLAVRRPNPANRRSSLIELTAAGQETHEAAAAVSRRAVEAAIGDQDVSGLTTVLADLLARLEQPAEGAAA